MRMKKNLKCFSAVLVVGLLMLVGKSYASEQIPLSPGIFKPLPSIPPIGKAPIQVPELWQDDHVLTFQSAHADLTLRLLDAGGNEVYSAPVSASTNMVVLPATLTGSYELRLETDTYYYIGYIVL